LDEVSEGLLALFDGLTEEQVRKFAPLPALMLAKRKFGPMLFQGIFRLRE
jgi:hypothetical protein